MTVLTLVVGLTLLISAFCSLFEATLYSTRVATLEAAARTKERRKAAQRFLQMKHDVAVPTSAILILNTIANTAGAALAGMYAAQVFGGSWVPAFSIALTFSILFLSEILPKTYGATHWRAVWAVVVWPLALIEKLLYPLIGITQRFARLFTPRNLTPVITEDEILAMIHLGAKTGQLTAAELNMLDAVFHFDKLLCRQVMVPRSDVVFLDVDWPLSECLSVVKRTRHTRYPLRKGSLDRVLGILHVKDLVGLTSDASIDLTSLMRPAQHVPETKPINTLLAEMQRTRQHMAIVVDEHGSTAGIITLENVLEEIVGTVEDEFDREEPDIVEANENQYLARGSAQIERVNRQLKLHLQSPNVNTLSGLLVAELGRLVQVGDVVELEGAVAEVLETEGNRASRIRLTLTRQESTGS